MIPVIIFFVRLGLTAREEEKPGLLALLPIYIAGGAFFMILHLNGSAMTQWARDDTDRRVQGSNTFIKVLNPWAKQDALPNYYRNADETTPCPDPRSLLVVDDYLQMPNMTPDVVARMYGQQRMDEAVIESLEASLRDGVRVERFPVGQEVPAPWVARAARVFPAGDVQVTTGVDSHGAPTVTVEVPDRAQTGRLGGFRARGRRAGRRHVPHRPRHVGFDLRCVSPAIRSRSRNCCPPVSSWRSSIRKSIRAGMRFSWCS